jgi:hypothetical protein
MDLKYGMKYDASNESDFKKNDMKNAFILYNFLIKISFNECCLLCQKVVYSIFHWYIVIRVKLKTLVHEWQCKIEHNFIKVPRQYYSWIMKYFEQLIVQSKSQSRTAHICLSTDKSNESRYNRFKFSHRFSNSLFV